MSALALDAQALYLELLRGVRSLCKPDTRLVGITSGGAWLAERLQEIGHSVAPLHGGMPQGVRNRTLNALRQRRLRVLVATDVAARGIDLPNMGLVIHADLPHDPEVLQHRSGRTGRAGRKGVSVLLVPHSRRRKAEILLRNARVLHPSDPNLVVCWGGHSIGREEYMYTKEVGYQLGLRRLDICTGCGPGAMKGPMKGATIAHAKQRHWKPRYIGITEPGIIAAESPNPIVNHLVIMPDIEKRLEAFVRLGHGIIVFPGGVGTAEEILYLLGLLLHPENAELPFPLILTGPRESAAYFEQIDQFLRLTLGEAATSRYRIIVDDAAEVAKVMREGIRKVREHRLKEQDAFFFNWSLHLPEEFQRPFPPTHAAMAGLKLHRDQPPHLLAADLRRAFSGIVAGNVKEDGMRRIEEFGPFEIHGDPAMMQALDALLRAFVEQRRMKIAGDYQPCYRVVT